MLLRAHDQRLRLMFTIVACLVIFGRADASDHQVRTDLLKSQIAEWREQESNETFKLNYLESEGGLISSITKEIDAGHWARTRLKWVHSLAVLTPINFALGKMIWWADPNGWFPPASIGLNNVIGIFVMIPAFQIADDFWASRFTREIDSVVAKYQNLSRQTLQEARTIQNRIEVTVLNRTSLDPKTLLRARLELQKIEALGVKLESQKNKIFAEYIGTGEHEGQPKGTPTKSYWRRPNRINSWNAQMNLTKAHYQNLVQLFELRQRLAQAIYTQLESELDSPDACLQAIKAASAT